MQSYSCRERLGRWTCWRIIQSYGCQLDNHTRGYRQRRKECKKRISKARSQGRQVKGAVLGVSQIPWQEGELQGAGWDVQRHGRRKAMAQSVFRGQAGEVSQFGRNSYVVLWQWKFKLEGQVNGWLWNFIRNYTILYGLHIKTIYLS